MIFNKKKRYFKNMLDGVQKMIWDREFKREKALMIREEVRKEYEKNKAKLEIIQSQIKTQKEKPTMEEGDIKRLDDQEVLLKRDIERYEAQMKQMDLDVNGSKETNEHPEGYTGINQELDSLRELQEITKVYIKTL